MLCNDCGAGLRYRQSYSNGKVEIWTCKRKGCQGREEVHTWDRRKAKASRRERTTNHEGG